MMLGPLPLVFRVRGQVGIDAGVRRLIYVYGANETCSHILDERSARGSAHCASHSLIYFCPTAVFVRMTRAFGIGEVILHVHPSARGHDSGPNVNCGVRENTSTSGVWLLYTTGLRSPQDVH